MGIFQRTGKMKKSEEKFDQMQEKNIFWRIQIRRENAVFLPPLPCAGRYEMNSRKAAVKFVKAVHEQ